MEFLDADLALKMAVTAVVVLIATAVVERAGAFLGAVVVALPISAGPAYVFIAIEHDAAFVARSAEASLALNVVMGPFLLVAAFVLKRTAMATPALAAALAVWAAGAFLALHVGLSLASLVALNAGAFLLSGRLARPLRDGPPAAAGRKGYVDVLLRVAAVACVVGLVVVTARQLGPRYAGVAALLPVVWISTVIVVKGRSGPSATVAFLANGVTTMNGFWIGLATLALTAERLGSAWALVLGLAASVATGLWLTLGRSGRGVRTA